MNIETLIQSLEHMSRTAVLISVGFVTLTLLFAIAVISLAQNARVKNSRQRIEFLLATTQQGFALWTSSGRIIDTNPAFRELTGLTVDQLRKRTIRDVFDRDLTGQVGKIQLETRIRRADGSSVPCLLDCNCLTRPGRRRPLCFALITDISELRVAIAEQTAIFESATVGIVQLKNRIIERANARCHEMLGYPAGELIGQSTQIWYESQEEYDRIGADAYPLIWRGETAYAQSPFRRKDGQRIWVRTSNRAIDPSDPAQGTVVMLQDVTAEREAIAAMTLANQEQTAILDTATCGVALIQDRTFVRCNRRLHDMFGWEHGDMVGRKTEIWYPDAASSERGKALYEIISQGKSASIELELKRRDGSRLWARLTGNAVDTQTPAKGTVWIIDDITQERAVTVALQQAKDAAEAATRAKSEFLSNMSHEIRTPMNAIIGMSNLALKTSLTAQQRNYIEKVHRAGTNLLGIINDVLDFSKIEAGKMHVEVAGFRVADVIDNVALIVGMKTEEKDLELVVRVADDVPPRLVGDALRLGQVLINLGSNAAKFTQQGEIVLGIDVAKRRGQDVVLHFWVRDTGIGMTPEQCERLFQSFTQADASTSRKYGGTGLGLAISKNLVELMRGHIWVDSVAGQGSTFHFQLPFTIDEHDEPARTLSADDLRAVRALVVDDNDAARDILVEMTRSLGMDSHGVSDAHHALHAISTAQKEGRPYRVLLTDWRMPVVDGVDLIEELGRMQGIDLPVAIMATAFRREDALAKARDRGIDVSTVLIKPVTPASLLAAVGAALGGPMSAHDASHAADAATQRAMDRLRGARVLLVDDNDMNLELAQELLASAGIEVVCATHGQAAIDVLTADPDFDGVLMDCQMPVMDGYAATRAIRAIERFKDLPILAMTANAMTGDKEKALASGMWDHIAKPYDVPTMFATMGRWIQPLRPAPPAASAGPAAPAPVQDASPPPATLLPAQLAGIDLQAGLRTSMGNEALYCRMLERFARANSGFGQTFDQAMSDTDPVAAQRCAHTLKGTAANIGAKVVALRAAELEEACKLNAAPDELRRRLEQTSDALEQVLGGLQAWLRARPAADASAAGTPAIVHGADQLAELIGQLRTHLQEGDARACEIWEQESPQFQAALLEAWEAIHRHVQGFEFEEALAILDRVVPQA